MVMAERFRSGYVVLLRRDGAEESFASPRASPGVVGTPNFTPEVASHFRALPKWSTGGGFERGSVVADGDQDTKVRVWGVLGRIHKE